MAGKTNIAWASFTASPWFVCTEVDLCCTNCYAREFTKQKFGWVKDGQAGFIREAYKKAGFKDWATMPTWGNQAPRVLSKGFWKDAYKWNLKAECAPERPRIFTSLIDWLDVMPSGIMNTDGRWLSPLVILCNFLQVVFECQNLDWLLLTKRPENFNPLISAVLENGIPGHMWSWLENWRDGVTVPGNVWFGVTVGTQEMADKRIPQLLSIPAKVRWLSVEPLLERIEFGAVPGGLVSPIYQNRRIKVDWVVVGGESGKNRRDPGVKPIIDVAQQCLAAHVPVFVKQDCGMLPGTQGRIPDEYWNLKQYPT